RPRCRRRAGLHVPDRDDVPRAAARVPRGRGADRLHRPPCRRLQDEPFDRARGRPAGAAAAPLGALRTRAEAALSRFVRPAAVVPCPAVGVATRGVIAGVGVAVVAAGAFFLGFQQYTAQAKVAGPGATRWSSKTPTVRLLVDHASTLRDVE